jgi:hypothetical protein
MIPTAAKVILGLTACLVLASPAPPAFAGTTVVTETQTGTFSESFDDGEVPCHDEFYHMTVDGRFVFHRTYRIDADGNPIPPFRLTEQNHAHTTLVPLDGTGPTFVGTFYFKDLETIRSVKHGQVMAETDTDRGRFLVHGSDGSRAWLDFHQHLTMNANGEVTAEFVQDNSMSCE